jgi:serine protease Do
MPVVALAAGGAAFGLVRTVGADGEGFRVRRTPVVAAVERAAPAVVNVITNAPGRQGGMIRGTGSGVIVHPAGYVVTNSHIVRGVSRIFVELASQAGGGRLDAGVVEDDPAHDLALIRVSRPTPFPYVALAPTSDVMVGETAIAIGNPLGLGETVTVGIISAVGRKAEMPSGFTIRGLIQTDASINRGNSGGALLNLEGALIGINSSTHPNAQGISFTVSSDDVRALLERNLVPSAASAPARPVASAPPASPPSSIAAIRSPVAEPPPASPAKNPKRSGVALKTSNGFAVVTSVESLSPADIAGLTSGDVIVDVDGRRVTSAIDCVDALSSAPSGKTVQLGVSRAGARKRVLFVAP